MARSEEGTLKPGSSVLTIPPSPYVASIPGFNPSRALSTASPFPVHNSI
ncbi:hypothetical protein QREC_QR2838_03914 [Escherichia coli]|nr:hypothetical protein QREC_QR2838_03914 [Escherichia coli]STH85139.1 Uncharacterised protein [Escherichia coli]